MLGYVCLGTNDLEKYGKFYDEVFSVMGAKRIMSFDHFVAWGDSPESAMLCLIKPHNGEAATVGNGVMAAVRTGSPDDVDAIYAKAMELGAQCEGPPGPRESGSYFAYFRDLEGNKLAAFYFGAAS